MNTDRKEIEKQTLVDKRDEINKIKYLYLGFNSYIKGVTRKLELRQL